MPVGMPRPLSPGETPRPADFNAMAEAVTQMGESSNTYGGDLSMDRSGGGFQVNDHATPGHWAKVTGVAAGLHSHVEVTPDGLALPAGQGHYGDTTANGTPAREVNGGVAPAGRVVWLELDPFRRGWVFALGGGGEPSSTSATSTTTSGCLCGSGVWTFAANSTMWSAVSNTCPAGCVPQTPQDCPPDLTVTSTAETVCVKAAKPAVVCRSSTSGTSTTTLLGFTWGGDYPLHSTYPKPGGCLAACRDPATDDASSTGTGTATTSAANPFDVKGFSCQPFGYGGGGPPAGVFATLDDCYKANVRCGKCVWKGTNSGIWALVSDHCCGCGKACSAPGFRSVDGNHYATTDCDVNYTSGTSSTSSSTGTSSTTTSSYTCFGIPGYRGAATECLKTGGSSEPPVSGPYATLEGCQQSCCPVVKKYECNTNYYNDINSRYCSRKHDQCYSGDPYEGDPRPVDFGQAGGASGPYPSIEACRAACGGPSSTSSTTSGTSSTSTTTGSSSSTTTGTTATTATSGTTRTTTTATSGTTRTTTTATSGTTRTTTATSGTTGTSATSGTTRTTSTSSTSGTSSTTAGSSPWNCLSEASSGVHGCSQASYGGQTGRTLIDGPYATLEQCQINCR